jgi:hypothetical protein
MKIGPQTQQCGTRNHAGSKPVAKAKDCADQNRADDQIHRKLIVLDGPMVFAVPISEGYPSVDVVVKK